MYARAVDDASARLQELRREEWQELALAGLALALALVATQIHPALAMPLFMGGVVVGARGMTALWRRWDLVDRLAAERAAHAIAEVRAYASRQATTERRHHLAALIRGAVRQPGSATDLRVRAAADDLEALASELEDESLALDPASAIACLRLLSDPVLSPLLNPELPQEDLRSLVHQIRSGFHDPQPPIGA
jgi:hypothetical protein